MWLPHLQTIVFLLFIPNMYAAERLLIMEVYARVIPIGQMTPVPDPFVESIVRGEAPAQTEGLLALQGKSFQISPKFQDFAPIIPGVDGQKVSIQFSAAVLKNGSCEVSPFRAIALAANSKGQSSPVGASETLRPGGFTVSPGSRIFESVTARTGGVTVIYYLIFSAAKSFATDEKNRFRQEKGNVDLCCFNFCCRGSRAKTFPSVNG
jgi:hypothetical protein